MTDLTFGFDSQGHRGARGLMPENTLAGFAKALSIGVTTLELDVGFTRDRVVVVSHNPQLEPEITRDENGNWLTESGPAIWSLTLQELRVFDVGRLKPGTDYAGRYPLQTPVDGARIPTLTELMDLVHRSGNADVRLNIETKLRPGKPGLTAHPRDMIAAILQVAREKNFLHRITIQSFDWRTLQEVQQQAPGVPTSYLTVRQPWLDNMEAGQPGPSPWTSGYDIDNYNGNIPRMIKAAGGHIWSSYHREVTVENIALAHTLGLKVKVWTVNDATHMDSLITMGVDGIITDYPERLRAVLETCGSPLPEPTLVPLFQTESAQNP
ncbi:MAG: glycerophosphodiester phosphodiesterase [Gammaproteobacteria bacterium]|nr:glycerophosphodiester phosphodiesterase [Gammaproteobacteria bacterium]